MRVIATDVNPSGQATILVQCGTSITTLVNVYVLGPNHLRMTNLMDEKIPTNMVQHQIRQFLTQQGRI